MEADRGEPGEETESSGLFPGTSGPLGLLSFWMDLRATCPLCTSCACAAWGTAVSMRAGIGTASSADGEPDARANPDFSAAERVKSVRSGASGYLMRDSAGMANLAASALRGFPDRFAR
jgi:hypothetical protein